MSRMLLPPLLRFWFAGLTAWCVVAVAAGADAQAIVEGTVMLRPKPMAPPPSAHYALKAGQIAPSPKQLAVVYLEGDFKKGGAGKTVVMKQEGYQFAPGVLAVQTGTRIEFPNHDDD
jgi:hypothetical protein